MARAKRTPGERAEDKRIIAEMYCEGHTQMEIVEWLNANRTYLFREDFTPPFVTQKMVSNDWQSIFVEWQGERLEDLDKYKRGELLKIDKIERIATDAWIRSREPAIVETTKGKGIGGNQVVDHERKKIYRDGNPQFLDKITWCIAKRCEILGLNAPRKREITGKDGGSIMLQADDLRAMTTSELQARLAAVKQLAEHKEEE